MRAELPANAAAAGNTLLTGECHGSNNACRARDVNCRRRARRRSPRGRRLAMQHKVAIAERTARPCNTTRARVSAPAVLATFSIRTSRAALRRHSVVVMQAIEDWECHDTTVCLGRSRHRLFLPQALMWPSLVVEANVVRDEAQKMALAKHEDMVEQFTPESADKALGEGVHVRGPDRGASDFGADGFKQAREPSA